MFTQQMLAQFDSVTLTLHFHLVHGLRMHVKGREMMVWITPREIQDIVIPAVNKIWSRARIKVVAKVTEELALPNRLELIKEIERSTPDREDPRAVMGLLDPGTFQANVLNIYVVPYIGSTLQGFANRTENLIVLGLWTDKPAPRNAPKRVLLTEPLPFQIGSLSRTVAHELGHCLGLSHPKGVSPIARLMGGKRDGYGLTEQEITTARINALNSVFRVKEFYRRA